MIDQKALNIDCMEYMGQLEDNSFDLAIVDPPYFSGPDRLGYYGQRISATGVKRKQYKKIGVWDVPTHDYYQMLTRVSRHQIIWGINYFDFQSGPGRIIWDKCNGQSSFSDCEIASISLIDSVRMFQFLWNGMMQGVSIKNGAIQQGNKKLNERRIHPTQKPVKLYEWILDNFAEKGWKILDTHLGSGSSRIACFNKGFDFVGCEMDTQYYEAEEERFLEHTRQYRLF